MKVLLSILILIHIFNVKVQALKCYTCSVSQNDIDQRCVTDPASVQGSAITDCNKNYCTSLRVEYLDPKGKVQSMNRDCVDKPTFSNSVIEDGTYRTYYRSCQTDLCNGGSGKDTSYNTGLGSATGKDTVLYVPGTGRNDAWSFYSCTFLVVSAATLTLTF